mgnify:CR=1 FL=1
MLDQPLAVGLNCALGAKLMRPYIEEISAIADTYVCAYPNAGLPNPLAETGYDESPEQTAAYVRDFAESGFVNVVGGVPRDDTFAEKYRDLSSLNDPELRFQMMWSDPSTADYIPDERGFKIPVGEDASLKVDPARVYVRGTSMGGGGSLHLAFHYPHLFAAAAPTTRVTTPGYYTELAVYRPGQAPDARYRAVFSAPHEIEDCQIRVRLLGEPHDVERLRRR